MKKFLSFVLIAGTLNLFAHFPIVVETEKSKGIISNVSFAPLQIGVGFFDKFQLYDGSSHSLLSIGVLGVCQKSAAISFAPLAAVKSNWFLQCGLMTATENNRFMTIALFNFVRNNYGLQIGFGNMANDECGVGVQAGIINGDLAERKQVQIGAYNLLGIFQLGIFNVKGTVQIGLLNYNPKSYIPWLPLINWDMGREE